MADGNDDKKLSRTPPVAVRHQLRQEVGWGCPMRDVGTDYCGSPYLTYHHFNPPWREEEHHRPEDMIALCWTHHWRADVLTVDQCRELKATALERAGGIAGRFMWMRNDILAIVGGNFYYETPIILRMRDTPLIWFERDENRNMLLNLDTPDASGRQRVSLRNNDWFVDGEPTDVECSPSGKQLSIRYADEDRLETRFREWTDKDALVKAYPALSRYLPKGQLQLTTITINMRLNGFGLQLNEKQSIFDGPNNNIFRDCMASHCGVGVQLGPTGQA